MGKGIPKKVMDMEEKAIGDLKANFISPTLRGQQHNRRSALEASGNISLSFYRGIHSGEIKGYQKAMSFLKKVYPDAYKFLNRNKKFVENKFQQGDPK